MFNNVHKGSGHVATAHIALQLQLGTTMQLAMQASQTILNLFMDVSVGVRVCTSVFLPEHNAWVPSVASRRRESQTLSGKTETSWCPC